MREMSFEIAGRRIGRGFPAYVIAEMSANHAGSFEEAAALVGIAAHAGADAVKLQTYRADTMTIDIHNRWMTIEDGLWEGRNLYELYEEAHTPWEWQPDLRRIAQEAGIELFSTAFDSESVAFLESMDVAVHKVASFEIVDLELVALLASTGKPLIISTGMSTMDEVEEAVQMARDAGASQIALLKCTSAYPAPDEEANLLGMRTLQEAFHVPVGYSDHTLGIEVPIAAVAMGAALVEKHFTRSRSVDSADRAFSLESEELESMISGIRRVESAMGAPALGPSELEKKNLVFRRSIFAIADIAAGEEITRENVRVIRPGYGIAPKHLENVLGRSAAVDIERGTPLGWRLLER